MRAGSTLATPILGALALVMGCAPPDELDLSVEVGDETPTIEIAAPIGQNEFMLDENGDLRIFFVIDIDGVDFVPAENPPREVTPEEAHFHLGFADLAPEDGGGYELTEQVHHELYREDFPPGNGYRVFASLQNNDHSDYLDPDGNLIQAIIEFSVVPFEPDAE